MRPRPLPRSILATIVLALLVTGCDGQEPTPSRRPRASDPSSTSASRAACPDLDDPRRVGSVSGLGLEEISGIEASERYDVLWVHEDSGADPVIHAITPDGSPVGSVAIDDAEHVDWEDIALAGGTVWVGDIGDNAAIRLGGIEVYWFREPDPVTTRSIRANTLHLTYEDGPHDAEALLVDADHEALYVITKELSLTQGFVYRAAIDGIADGDVVELERVGEVPLGIVTAADVAADGVVVKSYGKARLFPWVGDRSIGSALAADACPIPLGGGESVAYRADDDAYYAIPEGADPPIWLTAAG